MSDQPRSTCGCTTTWYCADHPPQVRLPILSQSYYHAPDPARAAFVAQVRVYFNNWGNREPITRLMGLIVQSFSVAYMQQHGQPETLRAIAEALEKATDDPL